MRVPIPVRSATRDDLPALLRLWMEAQDNWRRSDRGRLVEAPAAVATRLDELLDDPQVQVVVATVDEEPAGMTILAPGVLGPLSEPSMLEMSYAVVASRFRHRGVGRALVAATAAYAEELGYGSVIVNVPPALRDANRFFARLGFAPVVTRRAAPVAALRRLAADPGRRPVIDDRIRRRSRPAQGSLAMHELRFATGRRQTG